MSSRSTIRVVLIILALALILTAIGIAPQIATWRYSRHLDCEKQSDSRSNTICMSVERHLEYTCCGHAIISPGYRATWKTVTNVWCEQQITQKDIAALQILVKTSDWRLQFAAESLLRLLTGYDSYGVKESENSIFHPNNPSYLLKNKC